ncbi:MAG: aminoglycoside phosphotransferase family protein [bacterium]|nr:aminoglycoside phosphotransferase family protein [bacterium]
MHADEVDISPELIRKLLEDQFPNWADLPLKVIRPEGTDNAMYKLGGDKVVRLPRTQRSAIHIEKEQLWLPKLAPLLPISIPTSLGQGRPGEVYPFSWLICPWLKGKNPDTTENRVDPHQAAVDLGSFIAALQKIDSIGGPECARGQPLVTRDEGVREAISLSQDIYDPKRMTRLWEAALEVPAWTGDPVWIHGDLHAGNLLAKNGQVTAVVDFGSAGVGDPASDMMVAWALLTPETREIFRSIVQPDDDTWERGRGWALSFIVAYPYYRLSNPLFAHIAKRVVDEVLADSFIP